MDIFETIDDQTLTRAIIEHEKHLELNPHKRVICDATITPFAGAMKSLGYVAILTALH